MAERLTDQDLANAQTAALAAAGRAVWDIRSCPECGECDVVSLCENSAHCHYCGTELAVVDCERCGEGVFEGELSVGLCEICYER